ncbi:hypothetical protein [Sphingomonas sp. Root720]|nr:hypothetical protein [Sphingomonas sp. Root720]
MKHQPIPVETGSTLSILDIDPAEACKGTVLMESCPCAPWSKGAR